jgi:hypothetical protein
VEIQLWGRSQTTLGRQWLAHTDADEGHPRAVWGIIIAGMKRHTEFQSLGSKAKDIEDRGSLLSKQDRKDWKPIYSYCVGISLNCVVEVGSSCKLV